MCHSGEEQSMNKTWDGASICAVTLRRSAVEQTATGVICGRHTGGLITILSFFLFFGAVAGVRPHPSDETICH